MILLLAVLLILIICLLLIVYYFIIYPITRVGIADYAYYIKEITPNLTERIITHYQRKIVVKQAKEWYSKVKRIGEEQIPNIDWAEDKDTSKGFDSFYMLDNYADDVRPLAIWDLPTNNKLWWDAKFTNQYIFSPETQPTARYYHEVIDGSLHIKTRDDLDTWVYLASKKPQLQVYAIEFEFIPHVESQETLQIDFCVKHLASRFRFDLEQNKLLRFDIIDKAQFLNAWLPEWSKNLSVPCGLNLHKINYVRLEVIRNIFALYINKEMQLAVQVDNVDLQSQNWLLIFWNGTKEKINLDFEIKDFKIYHPLNS